MKFTKTLKISVPVFSRLAAVGFCLLILAGLPLARADVVLTNFSPAQPLKIMPLGDSITDDCFGDGAYRLYLQPLLETNGYNFTFVGRNLSTGSPRSPSFTKKQHEGYCGVPIAPPGYYGVHGYTTADAYLEKITPDALTNVTPDVILLLIGANDIGHGRDPFYVATNDMSTLLNLIFSNAPAVNVIIGKITSLTNGSYGYGAYYTNVSIYNAALQKLVNTRRAAGQNVFMADCFSTVDIATGFQSDHVHPNGSGWNSMAYEWLKRIQTISISTNLVMSTLIHGGDDWKYSDTGQDPGTNWTRVNYDDSGWSDGIARLGYGSLVNATTVNYGPDSSNKYLTTYFRHSFVVPSQVAFTNLSFRLARVDGAVVWLNGQEVFRSNMPSGPITSTNLASSPVSGTSEAAYIFYPTEVPVTALPAGTNVVAVEIHKGDPAKADLGFDLEMIGTGYPISLPSLTITTSGNNILLSWPAGNGDGYALYQATSLDPAAVWTVDAASVQTNAGQCVVTIAPGATNQFFRLQKP